MDDRPGGGRLVVVTVAGVAVAAWCGFVGYLLAPRGTFFGEHNSGGTRATGFAALLAGSVAFVAGPFYEAWIRKSVAMAAGGAVAAGVVLAAACLVAT